MDNKEYFYSVLAELLSYKYDSISTKNEDYAKQLINVHEEFVKRNKKLTDFLENYIEQRKERVETNKKLKGIIFWFFISLLAFLTVVVAVFILRSRNHDSISSAVSLVSVSVTYLASLIGVFEIMSKYLFPIDEEKDTLNMIKAVIKNDVKVEQVMSAAIQKNRSGVIEQLKEVKQLYDDQVLTQDEYSELKNVLTEKLKSR